MSSCVAPRSKCHWTADLSTKGLLAGLEAKKHRLGRCSPRMPAEAQRRRALQTRSRPVPGHRTCRAGPPGPRGRPRSLSARSGRPGPPQGNGTAVRSAWPPRHLVRKAQARYEREFLETKNQALFLLSFLIQVLYCRHVSLAIRYGRYTETKVGRRECAPRASGGRPPTPDGPSSSCPHVLSLPREKQIKHDPEEKPQRLFHRRKLEWSKTLRSLGRDGEANPTHSTRRRRAPAQEPSPGGGRQSSPPGEVRPESAIPQQSPGSCATGRQHP